MYLSYLEGKKLPRCTPYTKPYLCCESFIRAGLYYYELTIHFPNHHYHRMLQISPYIYCWEIRNHIRPSPISIFLSEIYQFINMVDLNTFIYCMLFPSIYFTRLNCSWQKDVIRYHAHLNTELNI